MYEPMQDDHVFPRLIFVLTEDGDPNHAINAELAVVNNLMTSFPGHIFLSRSTFILTELFQPRDLMEWANVYRNIVNIADAVYGHGDDDAIEAHPLVHYAYDLNCPVVKDPWDLGLFLTAADAE